MSVAFCTQILLLLSISLRELETERKDEYYLEFSILLRR